MPLPDGGHVYGDGTDSSIGSQLRTDFYKRKALVIARKEVYFGDLADTTNMPAHFGKTIKQYLYLPMLDDGNINSQGIDANGLTTQRSVSIAVTKSDGSIPNIPGINRASDNKVYFVGSGVSDAAAGLDARAKVVAWMTAPTAGGGLGLTLSGTNTDTYFVDGVNQTDGLAYVKGFRFHNALGVELDTVATATDGGAVPDYGNLYASSKDVGTIVSKFPALSETGGRVNRVGYTRVELEGTIHKFGFFSEYTEDSLNFDSDAELLSHINREMLIGAEQLTEDKLQIDLLNSAGIIRYPGAATDDSEISGETGSITEVTYDDIVRLSIDLDDARCPNQTKIITGSKLTDTKVVKATRYMYIGSELLPTLERLSDSFGNKVFIPLVHYANAATHIANGEVGSIGMFRVIVVPNMMHWAEAGATETSANAGYRASNGKYSVFPMLVVGDSAFTTIGFQQGKKGSKFRIFHKAPGAESATTANPYGEVGFMSIKWWYGFMVQRSERIAMIKTVARW